MRKSRKLKYETSPIVLHKPELHNTQISIISASKQLGISRQHLYRLIKRHGISIRKASGHITVKYKDLISILEKLDSNSDCQLCPAAISLKGLMKLTDRSRSWSLKYIDRYRIKSFYIGNSRRSSSIIILTQKGQDRTNGERNPFDFTNTQYFQQYSFTKNSNIFNLSFYEFFSILQLLAS